MYNVSWPGWTVEKCIGKGSFGQVYEISRDIFGSTERSALKVITIPTNPQEIQNLRAQGFDDPSIAQHFRRCLEEISREYALMAEVKGHPNIVYCDDFRDIPRPDGLGWDIYIKMELLTPLFSVIPSHYSESLTVQLGLDICNALILCQKKGILHRDIKPENIFYSQAGSFKLGDFGIAKIGSRTSPGTAIGTYDYMAPEVYSNQPYGFSADLYSLGVLLYWCMNDRRIPFLPAASGIPSNEQKERAWKMRMSGTPLPPPMHGSPQLLQVVMKACAFNPADRYQSAVQMRQALQTISVAPLGLGEEPSPPPPEAGFFRSPNLNDL